jgi:hypothetical protein
VPKKQLIDPAQCLFGLDAPYGSYEILIVAHARRGDP